MSDNLMGAPGGAEPSAVAEADVVNAEYVRGLVAGLSWSDLPELIAYACYLRARKAA